MAKKEKAFYATYERAKQYLKDKDLHVGMYIDTMLNRTQSMFKYHGLPDSIPCEELENLLQTTGNVFITNVDDTLYAFSGALGGELDVYDRPTKCLVTNTYLNLSKEYEINVDGILIKNDYKGNGLIPIISKYAALLTDSELSLNTAAILARISLMISACDDKTKASAELFIRKIMDGDLSVIGETAFFEGVKLQSASTGAASNYLIQLIEVIQYYKACAFNEIGLNANYNMKRESLNEREVALNVDSLIPLSVEMLNERKRGFERVNAMFGTSITVDLDSVWKTTIEEMEKATQIADTEIPDTESPESEKPESESPVSERPESEVTENDVSTAVIQ